MGADRLAVVLIDVDPAYFESPDQYLPKAKQVLERRNVDWPNAIARNGFNDTMRTFNVSGYGNIVVDARGIVRGVNLYGSELDRMVDQILEAGKGEKAKR